MDSTFPRNEFYQQAKQQGHSQQYLAETLEYADNLSKSGIPVIFSLKHLSVILGLSHKELKELIEKRDRYYSHYRIKKKSGGHREITSPHAELKFIQQWININILAKIRLSNACMGFRKSYSIKNNAEVHKNQEAILKVDLFRFFDSISERRVYGMFKELGYHSNLAVDLARLTTVHLPSSYWIAAIKDSEVPREFAHKSQPFLPQGAPTSPAISNIIARKIDSRLLGLATKFEVSYSRYADDITFSGKTECLPPIGLINKIVSEEGFYINVKKLSTQRRGRRQIVTGLTVSNDVHVPKKYKREILKHLHYCKKYGPIDHLKRISQADRSGYKDWLLGKICFVHSIEPEVGKKMMEQFNEVLWLL